MTIDYAARIPNNVDLANDVRLQRALESWQPRFLDWWRQLGPSAFQDSDVYLRGLSSPHPCSLMGVPLSVGGQLLGAIVVVDGARVVEVGTHEELMARAGQYADLFAIQAAAYRS